MTIKALFPTVRPSLNLDFAKTKALDPRVTFTRASTATFVGADGLIKTAASGVPRFDHNPTTGESLGLLVEEARTNDFSYSSGFDQSAWTKLDLNAIPNSALAPDGTLTAFKLAPNATETSHRLQRVIGGSTPSIFTIYLKAGEYTTCDIYSINPDFGARINLTNGTLSTSSDSPLSAKPATGISVQPVGNGWYRVAIPGRNSTNINNPIQIAPLRYGSFAGDGTSGIFAWGAQLEPASFPTSYIPTTGSTVTRAADVASMTGTNFSSWYRQDEGTLFIRYKQYANQGGWRGIFSGGSGNTFPALQTNNTGGTAQAWTQTYEASTSINITLAQGQQHKVAIGHKITSGLSIAIDGGNPSSISYNVAQSTATTINFTQGYYSEVNNQHISRFAFYPVRLPDAQFQALTAT